MVHQYRPEVRQGYAELSYASSRGCRSSGSSVELTDSAIMCRYRWISDNGVHGSVKYESQSTPIDLRETNCEFIYRYSCIYDPGAR